MENDILTKEEKKIVVEDKKSAQKKSKNINLYPLYRIFSWDLLFYYAIIYLFLTLEKGISAGEVLLFDGYYLFFKVIMQIPCTIIIQKIGKRKSLIIANLVLAIHILFIMFAPNFTVLLISQVLCAFSYIIKGTCETDMLYDSLEANEKRGSTFARIDGRANSFYYYVDSISAVLSSFLFVINPYIPMVICFIILLATFILATKFEEIHEVSHKISILDELKEIKYSFRNIFKSKRLKSLLLFNGIFVGLLKIIRNLRNTVLVNIGMPEQYFGVIFAVMGIIAGIATKNQGKIHKKYRNKTLAFISIPTAVSCLIIGVTVLCNFSYNVTVIILLILFAIQYIMQGPYYVLIKRYFNNFTNSDKRVKISTTNNICENLIASVLLFGASSILNNITIGYTTIIIGCITTILIVLLLDFMREKVGLKPEEYGRKEIL